jgi:hypothetical protein
MSKWYHKEEMLTKAAGRGQHFLPSGAIDMSPSLPHNIYYITLKVEIIMNFGAFSDVNKGEFPFWIWGKPFQFSCVFSLVALFKSTNFKVFNIKKHQFETLFKMVETVLRSDKY